MCFYTLLSFLQAVNCSCTFCSWVPLACSFKIGLSFNGTRLFITWTAKNTSDPKQNAIQEKLPSLGFFHRPSHDMARFKTDRRLSLPTKDFFPFRKGFLVPSLGTNCTKQLKRGWKKPSWKMFFLGSILFELTWNIGLLMGTLQFERVCQYCCCCFASRHWFRFFCYLSWYSHAICLVHEQRE